MTEQQSASEQIVEAVSSWPGVTVGPGARGASVAFTVGGREIGHLHGDRSAHFGFPKTLWDELIQEGRVAPHPIFPDSRGPAARQIASQDDVREVIELLRLNYDLVIAGGGVAETA